MEIYVSSLVLEVTRRCNMHCDHCLRGDAQNLNISDDVLEMVARDIKPSSITFTGGEPSLNVPAIQRYFELAEKYGNLPSSFYVVTNGKTNQRELALTLLDAYGKMDEPEMCGITVSRDLFHDDVDDGINIFKGLSFFDKEAKTHDSNDFRWLLNSGRAYENGIGEQPARSVAESLESIVDSTWSYKGEPVVEFDQLYVSSNGNIIDDCDQTYEDIDELAFCNIANLKAKVQEILNTQNEAA